MKKICMGIAFWALSGLTLANAFDPVLNITSADAGYQSIQLGDYKITALHDGNTAINPEVFNQNFSPMEIQALFHQLAIDPAVAVQESVNAFLIEDASGYLTLIDTGAGQCEQAELGGVARQLTAAGYVASDVGTVLLTHLHPDHFCGLEQNAQAEFPFATVYVSEKEQAYWLSEPAQIHLTEAQQARFQRTVRQIQTALAPYQKIRSLRTFKAGTNINGIDVLESAGHTPGHYMFQLSSQGKSIVFIGDLLQFSALQLVQPKLSASFDDDPVQSGNMRENFLAQLEVQNSYVAGAHLPFPGIGKIQQINPAHYEWDALGSSATSADE